MRNVYKCLVFISAVTIPLLLVSEPTFGENFCKWTDEDGVVHFAANCPENVESATVVTEGNRTEAQIRQAEQHSKSLLTDQARQKEAREQAPASMGSAPDGPSDQQGKASQDFSQMSAQQLEALCQEEREKRLAPEREQLIKDCIDIKLKSPGYCQRYYSDHGAAVRLETGYVRPALYSDLPECVAAWEARRKQN